MPEGGAAPSVSAPQQIARLMDGYLITQLLYVAAKLGVADELAGGPRDAESIARAVGAQPEALQRVLRGLAAEDVLEELPDGRFGLNALGTCLRADAPGSQRGAILVRGDVYYAATAGLVDAVRHGGSAFQRVHGQDFFACLAQQPQLGAAFQGSMTDRSRQEASDVVAAYDFGGVEQLVDVGGGSGILLESVLMAAPRSRGVLMDLPPVVDRARVRLDAVGLADRCSFTPGDFFEAVPRGGDMYVLSRVIHDWGDEESVHILSNCRAAMMDDATLLLVEALLPRRAREQPAAIRMDLHMLALLSGRERTVAEYEQLLGEAGLRLTRVVPTRSAVGLSVIEAAPSA
jgi:hypothetical protein